MANETVPFEAVEYVGDSHFGETADVLLGIRPCIVFRGFATGMECAEVLDRFLSHPRTRVRTGDATGRYLGTFHWRKKPSDYLAECESIRPAVAEVLGSDGPWRRFESLMGELVGQLHPEGVFRNAKWGDSEVVSPLIRAWDGAGEFSLVPHEDLAQIHDPDQEGFEAQKVASFVSCSANLCIANGEGGDLVMWDWQPFEADRIALGTQLEGGPYPAGSLVGYRRFAVHVRPGDLYVFDGGLVHAVTANLAQRATVSTLLGYAQAGTVVAWT